MKPPADWMAWTLQFITGFFVGSLVGWLIYNKLRRHHRSWVGDDYALWGLVLGGAFLLAGLASRYGDRFWLGDNVWVVPATETEHNELSRRLSWICIILGTIGMALTMTYRW